MSRPFISSSGFLIRLFAFRMLICWQIQIARAVSYRLVSSAATELGSKMVARCSVFVQCFQATLCCCPGRATPRLSARLIANTGWSINGESAASLGQGHGAKCHQPAFAAKPAFDFCGCMGAAFPPRLRFVFPHACTKRKEKFRFRIWCRDRDVVPAGLDALASAGRANWPIVCAKTTRLFRSQSADFPQNIVTASRTR